MTGLQRQEYSYLSSTPEPGEEYATAETNVRLTANDMVVIANILEVFSEIGSEESGHRQRAEPPYFRAHRKR